MTRVLITNAYSARNRGDAAIVLGMIESLRRTEVFRHAEIQISSVDHPADSARYPVPVIESFHSIKNSLSRRSGANQLFFLVVLLPLSLLWALVWRLGEGDLPIPGRLRRLLRSYADADVVVAAGGGYLYTTSMLHGNIVLLVNVYSFVFATLLGKPVCLYAQSIGPFAGSWQRWLVHRALARVALVEVREEVSRELVDGWRLSTPVRKVADAAFLLEAHPPERDLGVAGAIGGPTVGITVRAWFRDPEQQSRYERSVAGFVDWLVDQHGAEVVFLPQVTFVDGGDDDRVAARGVVESVARRDRVRVVEDELAAAEVKWLCGEMDFFVGTRMHSNIFALSSGIPTLAIAYQPKTEGIMADLGLGEWVLPIEGVEIGKLKGAFDRLVDRGPEIRRHLGSTIPVFEAKALEAGRLIAEDFARRRDRQSEREGGS